MELSIYDIYMTIHIHFVFKQKMNIFDVWTPIIKLNYNFKELFLKKKENYRK